MNDTHPPSTAPAASEPASGTPAGTRLNRLAEEKSPYLRLHATNPVAWLPWGAEAFEKARREDKPIFLSVGYYTCHWCHVMERESFANPAIGELLNRDFVSIKVDREERPDIDRLYMAFVQAQTGGGGWPMSVFLTPDLKPFLGGTYFPPEDRFSRPGFASILRSIAHAWRHERARVVESAEQIVASMSEYLQRPPEAGELSPELLTRLFEHLLHTFDRVHGGFGSAPKFPRPVALTFLTRYQLRSGDCQAQEMVTRTLDAMARGGVYDQLGGGFHRYSTDALWLVPHFEKMLYDQAQLVVSYLEAYQLTGNAFYAHIARETLAYVRREMTDAGGGFYSAQDADSAIAPDAHEHTEGAFYVFTLAELNELLGEERAAVAAFYFGARAGGNVEPAQDPQGELTGKNVLHVAASVAETADRFGRPAEAIEREIAAIRRTLFDARAQRPAPPTDDKVLTAWNGLMIGAFADAARILGEPEWLEAAQRAAGFLRTHMWRELPGGRHQLLRRFREGDAAIAGFVEDYAYLIAGLLSLFSADGDAGWLAWAVDLQREQDARFAAPAGGYFGTEPGAEPDAEPAAEAASEAAPGLFVRLREDYDGAEPSPNSIAALNLLRLAALTGDEAYRHNAERLFQSFAERLQELPEAVPALAAALDEALTPPRQLLLVGAENEPELQRMRAAAARHFLPHHLQLLVPNRQAAQATAALTPPLREYLSDDAQRPAAYLCENFACQLPVHTGEELETLLKRR